MAVVLLLMSACGTDREPPNAKLADLPGLRLTVQVWSRDETKMAHGSVTLSYDQAGFRGAHGDECAVLDDAFSGTLDGVRFTQIGHGARYDDFDDCSPPGFSFDARLDGPTVFVASDDSLTVTAAFAPDAFEPHLPTLLEPDTWEFSGGQSVRMSWSHPADLAALTPGPRQLYFHTGTSIDPNTFDLTPQIQGNEISFTIPDPPPITGHGLIVFSFGYAAGNATRCEGLTRCEFSADRGTSHAVVIAR